MMFRMCKALFNMGDPQRQNLMAVAVLIGPVVLTALLACVVYLAQRWYAWGDNRGAIVEGIFYLAYALTGLIGAFVLGIVIMAHNKKLKGRIKTPAGEVEFEAEGGGVRHASAALKEGSSNG